MNTPAKVASMNIARFIEQRVDGKEYTADQIAMFCRLANEGKVDDAQLGAWLMAVRFKGMTTAETTALTVALAASGRQLDMSGFSPALLWTNTPPAAWATKSP